MHYKYTSKFLFLLTNSFCYFNLSSTCRWESLPNRFGLRRKPVGKFILSWEVGCWPGEKCEKAEVNTQRCTPPLFCTLRPLRVFCFIFQIWSLGKNDERRSLCCTLRPRGSLFVLIRWYSRIVCWERKSFKLWTIASQSKGRLVDCLAQQHSCSLQPPRIGLFLSSSSYLITDMPLRRARLTN